MSEMPFPVPALHCCMLFCSPFHTQESSAHFAAPEVMQNAFGGHYDAMKADIWSCGIMLYIMLFGRHPFVRDQVGGVSGPCHGSAPAAKMCGSGPEGGLSTSPSGILPSGRDAGPGLQDDGRAQARTAAGL